ncbi:vernalization5/VIN3-like [Striga asiatica]|uniref:Vernalization5/VIN3-like n=1 Tax=Striga asiatica TaxID=4170 RepID=A0A5A7R3N7_STRAF|nr:vernalization5/VIN3-like [Striga asiatica]
MEASSMEVLFDPSKCSKLSIDQKRELVYELSNWSDGAIEILHTWSRHDILQILCSELGKERKYTGLNKTKIIEQLLKIINEKKPHDQVLKKSEEPSENDERTSKRLKKSEQPSTDVRPDNNNNNNNIIVYCKNSACRAKMSREDPFCKRCSCCICYKYDDNKDPSLWLVCNSDSPFCGASCGLSCHLECALRHKNSKIGKDKQDNESSLDGSFCCVSCGKVNDLLGSWRKQLVVAKDTRRVDILCYRLSLAQKILAGTKLYQNLCGGIDEGVRKLENEVGPLTGLPVKMARGIVNRLSSGPEIQRLCDASVKSLDSMLSERSSEIPSDCSAVASKLVRIEVINNSSVRIILNSDDSNTRRSAADGYMLWLRKLDDTNYPTQPTCRIYAPNAKYFLPNLIPNTDYFLKVVILEKDRESGSFEIQFRTGDLPEIEAQNLNNSNCSEANCSSLSNPSSVDETNNNNDKTSEELNLFLDKPKNDGNSPVADGSEKVKKENLKKSGREKSDKDSDEPQAGSSSKKREKNRDGECSNKDLEYCVQVIRRLECEGYIESGFRQQFLTWYSLRASSREVGVVRVFVDTFIEDLESLAGQLVDAFSEVVSGKRCSTVPEGFCLKLWH